LHYWIKKYALKWNNNKKLQKVRTNKMYLSVYQIVVYKLENVQNGVFSYIEKLKLI